MSTKKAEPTDVEPTRVRVLRESGKTAEVSYRDDNRVRRVVVERGDIKDGAVAPDVLEKAPAVGADFSAITKDVLDQLGGTDFLAEQLHTALNNQGIWTVGDARDNRTLTRQVIVGAAAGLIAPFLRKLDEEWDAELSAKRGSA